MKQLHLARPRLSLWKILGFFLLALAIGGGATLGLLVYLGVELPFLARVPKGPPEGTIPVVVSSRPIPAYTRITRDHFLDARTGEPTVRYVTPEGAKKAGFITDLGKILGRVLIRDKSPGYAFTEKDLFPEGTRPGLAAGVPPGKRAFVLHSEKILGIHGLKAGDHFDLLASMPVDLEKNIPKLQSGGSYLNTDALPKRASVRPLVQNGRVVIPLAVRDTPSNQKNNPAAAKPVHEITVAVDPEEVAPLAEALAISANIICVARSGQPDEQTSSRMTPGSQPTPKIRTMEIIQGGKTQILAFPTPGQPPQPQPPTITADANP